MTAKTVSKALMFAVAVGVFTAGNVWAQDSWNCGKAANEGGASSVQAVLSGGTLTISGTGDMANYNDGSISGPASPWYSSRSYITKVVIDNGVTSMGDYAFYNCSRLTSVTIAKSVTSIGKNAFVGCDRLTAIAIPDGVLSIGQRAFANCTGLKDVTIGEAVKSFGDEAFRGCTGINAIVIPASITNTGLGTFSGCTGLTSVTIPNSVTHIGLMSFNGCTALDSVTFPNSVINIGMGAFLDCGGLKSVIIPDNSVTSIESMAFSGCTSLTSITIPNSVISIGSSAFSGCTDITSITIPNSVTSIGTYAFYGCTSLTSIFIPNSVTSIGTLAFSDCTGLTSIEVGADNVNYSSLDGVLFHKDKSYLMQFPEGKQGAYSIPNGVTDIGLWAFSNCTGITSLTIPNSVIDIGMGAFSGCTGLTSVTIGNGVEMLLNAFSGCTGLTTVTIGSGVAQIVGNSFSGSSGLTHVISLNTVPPLNQYTAFSGVNKTAACLYVPQGSIDTYGGADGWKDFSCIKAKEEYTSIASRGLDIPLPPTNPNGKQFAEGLSGNASKMFTIGPNPAAKDGEKMSFFWQGGQLKNTVLSVYDASGNLIKKVSISDSALNNQAKRAVGSWDLKDSKGRDVSAGTYVIKGTVKMKDGKKEKVSAVLGVR